MGKVYEGRSLERASKLCTAADFLDMPWVMSFDVVGDDAKRVYTASVEGLPDRDTRPEPDQEALMSLSLQDVYEAMRKRSAAEAEDAGTPMPGEAPRGHYL